MTLCFVIKVALILSFAFSISAFVLFILSTVLFNTSYDSFTYFTSDSKSSLIFSNSAIFLSFSSQTLQDSEHFSQGLVTSITFSTSTVFTTSTSFSTSTIFSISTIFSTIFSTSTSFSTSTIFSTTFSISTIFSGAISAVASSFVSTASVFAFSSASSFVASSSLCNRAIFF
ncbi:hypothetical protein HanRHA438_Chr09g0381991 [Helianthus annuus]|nr:hypothetical protein HanRHA438_Chr09g0381991 [Helianthus annuus]